MNKGWECPRCGKVLAPWREECDHVIRMSVRVSIPAGVPEPEPPNWPGTNPWHTYNDPRISTTWSM